MELSEVWKALLRRWYFVLVGIVATVGATYLVTTSVGPTYHVEGSVLLLPPEIAQERDPTAQVQGNPYLYLGGLTAARDVVVKAVTSRTARDKVDAIAPGAEYEVTPDFDSSGPIFLLKVDAPTRESALAGLNALIASIPPTLRDLQDGLSIESSAFISSRVITSDVAPETVRKGQIRAAIATAAAVSALSVLAIGLLDGLMGGRRRRGGAGEPEHDQQPAVAAAPPEPPRDPTSTTQPVAVATEGPDAEEPEPDEELEPDEEPEPRGPTAAVSPIAPPAHESNRREQGRTGRKRRRSSSAAGPGNVTSAR
jgi:hypothetical protein